MKRLGIGWVLLALLLTSGWSAAPGEAATIGSRRPVVVIGTILENQGDGQRLVIGDVVDGTANALRVYSERGRVPFDSSGTEARDGTYWWEATMDCSSEAEIPVCTAGAQVDVLGHVSDTGPLAGTFVADVVRPVSGLGVTRRTSANVVVLRDKVAPCPDTCGRIDGLVTGGEFAGWDLRMDYGCTNGFHATWRLSRYGTTLIGFAEDFYDPFIGIFEAPEQRGGKVTGGTNRFAGAAGVASIAPLQEPCGFSPSFTIQIELVPGF